MGWRDFQIYISKPEKLVNFQESVESANSDVLRWNKNEFCVPEQKFQHKCSPMMLPGPREDHPRWHDINKTKTTDSNYLKRNFEKRMVLTT